MKVREFIAMEVARQLKELQAGSKEEYQKFFKQKLKDRGIKSPEELSDAEKKKFFDMIEREWTKDDDHGKKSSVRRRRP